MQLATCALCMSTAEYCKYALRLLSRASFDAAVMLLTTRAPGPEVMSHAAMCSSCTWKACILWDTEHALIQYECVCCRLDSQTIHLDAPEPAPKEAAADKEKMEYT